MDELLGERIEIMRPKFFASEKFVKEWVLFKNQKKKDQEVFFEWVQQLDDAL